MGNKGSWGGARKVLRRLRQRRAGSSVCQERAEVGAEWSPQLALVGSGDRRWWRREQRRWVDHTCRGQTAVPGAVIVLPTPAHLS